MRRHGKRLSPGGRPLLAASSLPLTVGVDALAAVVR